MAEMQLRVLWEEIQKDLNSWKSLGHGSEHPHASSMAILNYLFVCIHLNSCEGTSKIFFSFRIA